MSILLTVKRQREVWPPLSVLQSFRGWNQINDLWESSINPYDGYSSHLDVHSDSVFPMSIDVTKPHNVLAATMLLWSSSEEASQLER